MENNKKITHVIIPVVKFVEVPIAKYGVDTTDEREASLEAIELVSCLGTENFSIVEECLYSKVEGYTNSIDVNLKDSFEVEYLKED